MKKAWLVVAALALTVGLGRAGEMKAAGEGKVVCLLSPASGSQVTGRVEFIQKKGYVQIRGVVRGLTPGQHGFHVHEKGDCSKKDAASAGGHFNPGKVDHCAPECKERHAGDLGNIKADKRGVAKFDRKDKVLQLSGEASIIGRSLIVHEKEDDLKSQPAGNAGARIACGVIKAEK